VTVRAEIANPKRILVDQQLVGVVVMSKEPERKLVVSQSAIMLSAQGASVLAVTPDNKVETRKVEVGEQRGADIVITGGLTEGDRVIVSGHQKVRPGMVVAPSEMQDDLSTANK
jgi:membrane fusion protein (multidrug efflux system)